MKLLRSVGFWLGLAVSALAAWWLVRSQDWQGVGQALARADWRWLALTPVILLPNWALRGLRWRFLFPPGARPRFLGVYCATMAGYLFNNLLPAHAGELVRAHLLGRRERIARSAAFATVVVEKTLDLMVLLALLAIILSTRELPGWTAYAAKIVAAVAFVAFCGVLVLGIVGERVIGWVTRGLGFLPAGVTARIGGSGQAFASGLAAMRRGDRVLPFLLLTVGIWLLEVALAESLARAVGIDIGPGDMLFVLLAIALGTMVPASPGYVGTFEFFGLAALSLIGIAESTALGFVILLHVVLLASASAMGAVCVAVLGWPRLDEGGA